MAIYPYTEPGWIINQIAYGSLHLFVICFCIVAFRFQTRVLQGPRFLNNLIAAWSFIGFCSFVNILMDIACYTIASTSGLGSDSAKISHIIFEIGSVYLTISLMLSFTGTYFVIRAWYLLRNYPRQEFGKGWLAITQGLFSLLITLAVAALIDRSYTIRPLIIIMDALFSTMVTIMLGHAFLTFNPKPRRSNYAGFSLQIRVFTFVIYLVWGVLQVFTIPLWLQSFGWVKLLDASMVDSMTGPGEIYFILRIVVTLICAMSAVVFSIVHIPDKPEFIQPHTGIESDL